MTSEGDLGPGSEMGVAGQSSPAGTYAEFRVRIEHGTRKGSYRVVASGPAGQAEEMFRLPFSDTELENFVLKVGGTRKGVRSIDSPEMALAKKFGGSLFEALFGTDVRALYRASAIEASNAGQGLRITLALTSVPELLRVPWEYLYDRPSFPSTDRLTPIVRYLDLPKPVKPFRIQLPLRILAIVSAPTDAPVIDATQERAKLEAALEPLTKMGSVEIDWLEDANLSALFKLLSSKDRPPYHVLHFIGHGGYANDANEGVLLFEGKDGKQRRESGDKLGTILRGEDSIRLAVLNSCEGARPSLSDPFSSVATSLIEHGIPAVIGMQFEITDQAAILFSSAFYAALAEGRPVDESLSQARMTIFADDNDIEWGTPVLFMRVTDGRLFDLLAGPAVAPPAAGVAPESAPTVPVALFGETSTVVAPPAPPVESPPPASPPPTELATAGDDERRRREEEAAEAEQQRLTQEAAAAAEAKRHEAARREAERRRRIGMIAVAGGVLGVVLLALVFFVLPGSASITVSAAPGGGSDAVHVTGTGFGSREVINLSIGAALAGTATATDTGAFDTTITVPAGAAPSIDVTARGRASGRSATSSFALVAGSGSPQPTGIGPGATPSDAGPTSSNGEPTPAGGSTTPPAAAGRIVFYSSTQPDSTQTDHEIYVIDPVTKQVDAALTDNDLRDTSPVWSPDRSQIAFVRGPTVDRDLYVMNADGTSQTPLVGGPTDDYFPAWLRDGSVMFVRKVDGKRSIWVVRNGAPPAWVVDLPDEFSMTAPGWSPDGTQLAVWGGGQRGRDNDLYILHLDGTFERLTSGDFVDRNPAWSPGGRTIAFVRSGGSGPADSDIWLFDVKTRMVSRQVTNTDVNDGAPVWSPTGRQLAFCRQTPGGGFEIWTVNADGTEERDLMKGRGGPNLDPSWH